jgi:O-antigen ligase
VKGLILTYALAYGGSLLALFFPLVGLCVYVAFSVARPQMLYGWAGDMTGLSRIVGVAVLIGWALKGFGNWSLREARLPVFALCGFFVCLLVSAVFASHQGVAWDSVIEQFKFFLPFLAGITLMQTRAQVNALAWTIVLAQGLVGFEMNLMYLRGFNQARELGLLGDNNTFAVSLVTVVGPALFLGFSAPRWWQKAIAFACAGLTTHTVLLTFSRGGILSLIVAGLAILIVMPKRPAYMLALVLAAALAIRFTGPELLARFQTSFAAAQDRDASADSRLKLWQDCFTVMIENPVTGIGPRHWPLVAAQYGWPERKAAHTYWLEVGAEIGVPGLLFLVVFFASSLWRAWQLTRRRDDAWLMAMGGFAFTGLVGFACGAQFVTSEGIEIPFFVALVGLAALEVARLATAPVASDRSQPATSKMPVLARQAMQAQGSRRAAR